MTAGPGRLLTAIAVSGVDAVRPGDPLAERVCHDIDRDRIAVKDGDVLVIPARAQALAEGRVAPARSRAEYEALVDAQTREVVATRTVAAAGGTRRVTVSRTHLGTVQPAAGVGRPGRDGHAVLLPRDADAAADGIRRRVESYFGVRLAVILADSAARPWRRGRAGFALGSAGFHGLAGGASSPDGLAGPGHAGSPDAGADADARAVADEVAAAADLVAPSAAGLAVAIVRGLAPHVAAGAPGARALNRDARDDWFRHGHVEAVRAALDAPAGGEPPLSTDGDDDVLTRVTRALAAARHRSPRTPGQDQWRMRVAGAGARILITRLAERAESTAGGHPLVEAAIGLGALIERLHIALRTEGLTARVRCDWAPDGSPAGAELTIELVLEDS